MAERRKLESTAQIIAPPPPPSIAHGAIVEVAVNRTASSNALFQFTCECNCRVTAHGMAAIAKMAKPLCSVCERMAA